MTATPEIFVGRHHEVESLCALLDAACAGNGRLALIAGEPGIGKTRIALELTSHAVRRDARAVWGRCHEEAGAPPYWPWVQILRTAAAARDTDELRADLDAGASDIADLLPEIRKRLPDLEPPITLRDFSETRFRLFGSIAQFLINVSRSQTLVLVLDDLHWADVPSLRLLEFLAQETADSRLLVVCTYRETMLSRQHQLSDTLGALARVPNVVRLRLLGLNAEDVRRFVVTTAGMVPPAWLTSVIHDQTNGNPLFVREIVRFLARDGHFSSLVSATASQVFRLPEGVREVIGRRLNQLSVVCNETLAVAAVIGREFTLAVLARALRNRTEETVLEALDEAILSHIIEEIGRGLYQFTHGLVRITLYDELRGSQRRRLHQAVGEALEALHRRDQQSILADLAHHFHAAGPGDSVERAIDYAIRAGRRADASLAFEDAISFYQNALDMLDTMSTDDPDRRCNILLLLGEAQRKASDYPQALETLLAAADIARARQNPVTFAEVAMAYADTAWRHDVLTSAQSGQMLEEALAGLSESEAVLRVRLTGLLARDQLYNMGVTPRSKALAEKAVAMARALGDPATLATSLAVLANFPSEPSETEDRFADAIEMTEMAKCANDLEIQSQGVFRCMALSLELGDIRAADEAMARLSQVNARLRQSVLTRFELGLKAMLAVMRGRLTEAEQIIIKMIRIKSAHRTNADDSVSLLIFTLRREQGRLGELAPFVSMFISQNTGVATWLPGLALLHLELGDRTAARAVLDRLAGDDFASLPRDGRWTTCLAYLAEVCAALRVTAHAAVLYRLLLPWADRNIVLGGGTACWGSAGRFLGLLATVMGDWRNAEHHFETALVMNERVDALAPLAHTHCDYAAMLLDRDHPGDRTRATDHLREAEKRATALGLIPLTGRVVVQKERLDIAPQKLAVQDHLTTRELDVLRLMAIGRGNADIALTLEISLNTAARHVHNILTKTGCANRTEAAAYAVRHGLYIG